MGLERKCWCWWGAGTGYGARRVITVRVSMAVSGTFQAEVEVQVKVTNKNFTEELNNKSSPVYMEFEEQFKKQVRPRGREIVILSSYCCGRFLLPGLWRNMGGFFCLADGYGLQEHDWVQRHCHPDAEVSVCPETKLPSLPHSQTAPLFARCRMLRRSKAPRFGTSAARL